MKTALIRAVAVVAVTATAALLGGTPAGSAADAPPRIARAAAAPSSEPLSGLVIALDPGHQLGNHNFPREINRQVPAGGFTKPCNTTGTATTSGVAEATVNFLIVKQVQYRLQHLGATVHLTRIYNSQRLWGPCVNTRGEYGARTGSDLEVSLHADGAAASAHGFHVIVPTRRSPWTTDIYTASYKLGSYLRNSLTAYGVPRSTYIGGGTGMDVRSDLGTLNMSDVPIAMIEVGNMKNSSDAARMLSTSGRARYADAVVHAIRAYFHRA